MQQWFNNFNRREQLILFFGVLSLVLYLSYILLWSPLSESQARLRAQNAAAAQTLAKVESLAAQYKSLKQSGLSGNKGTNKSLSQIVDGSVAMNQLRMKRFQPSSSGDAQVRFENVVFNNVIAWLYDIENSYGLLVKDLSITPGKASGYVDVSVRLSQGS